MNDQMNGSPFKSIYELLQARMQMSQFGQGVGQQRQGPFMSPQYRAPSPQRPLAASPYSPQQARTTPDRTESVWNPFSTRFGDKRR